jgi:hypothetical protein
VNDVWVLRKFRSRSQFSAEVVLPNMPLRGRATSKIEFGLFEFRSCKLNLSPNVRFVTVVRKGLWRHSDLRSRHQIACNVQA